MSVVQAILLAAVLGGVGYVGWLVVSQIRRHERQLGAIERGHRLAEDRTHAALERAGAVSTRPILVESAAAIEPRAESEPCPICAGHLHVNEHVVVREDGRRLRRIELRCGDCGRIDTLWFSLRENRPN